MPSVKVTKLLEVLDNTVDELKAGDPKWTPAQRRYREGGRGSLQDLPSPVRPAVCRSAQTIPPDGPVLETRVAASKAAAKKKSR